MKFNKESLMNQIVNNIPLSKRRHQIIKGGKKGKAPIFKKAQRFSKNVMIFIDFL
jgi:hypothetical protein